MRSDAGQSMGWYETAIVGGRTWTPDEIAVAGHDRGRVTMAWDMLKRVAARSDIPKQLAEAIASAGHAFIDFMNGTQKTWVDRLIAGQTVTTPLAEVIKTDLASLGPIVAVAETALREIVARAQDQREQAMHRLALNLLILLAAIALPVLAGAIAYRRIIGPIQGMTAAMRRLADRDMSVVIPGVGRADEVGAMAAAVRVFRDSMVEADGLAARERDEQVARQARIARMDSLNGEFQHSASKALDTLTSAAARLHGTARGMSATSTTAARQTDVVSTASDQASANVQTVAAASEQLAASIQEIIRQIAQSSTISGQAVTEAAQTSAAMRDLSGAAENIGGVVRLISDIAGRTNLLALNATIEAARAGEAGRGFAVVASEVKSLANQTARATQDISAQVAAMRDSTAAAVAAIARIGTTIGRMDDIAASIAAAMEEQGAATQEIARNVQQASQGTSLVSGSIGGLNQMAETTGTASAEVLVAADALASEAAALRARVDLFLTDIRAA